MSNLIKLCVCACFIILCSARASKHAVRVVVSNSSADGKAVDMKFQIEGKKEGGGALLGEHEVKPGLQALPEKKLKEDVYQVQVEANNSLINSASQPFTLDSDRWVLINYIREDSASIVKSYGYIDPARFKKVDGKYATVYISVTNRKPAGL